MSKEEIIEEFEKYVDKMFRDRFIVDTKLFNWGGKKIFKKTIEDFWLSKRKANQQDLLKKIDKEFTKIYLSSFSVGEMKKKLKQLLK